MSPAAAEAKRWPSGDSGLLSLASALFRRLLLRLPFQRRGPLLERRFVERPATPSGAVAPAPGMKPGCRCPQRPRSTPAAAEAHSRRSHFATELRAQGRGTRNTG